jgi:signal transduction histidine kinase
MRCDVRARRAGGEEFPAEVTVARTPHGGDDLYTLILRDVSERHRAEEDVRRLNAALDQRLRAGIDMVADLGATLDPSQVLGRLLLRAASAVHADRGTLLRIDPLRLIVENSHELHHVRRYDRRTRLVDQPLLRTALEERQPIIASPFTPRLLPAACRAWGGVPRHVAVLPLGTSDAVNAILLLAREGDEAFVEEDLDMLRLIGSVAVVALRNAELFRQAEESSRSKSEFLNLAAHELRTPLSVVRGYASMLNDGSLGEVPGAWSRPLEVMDVKLRELNALVDDLLTAARADAGEVGAVQHHPAEDGRTLLGDPAQQQQRAVDRMPGEPGISVHFLSARHQLGEEPDAGRLHERHRAAGRHHAP